MNDDLSVECLAVLVTILATGESIQQERTDDLGLHRCVRDEESP